MSHPRALLRAVLAAAVLAVAPGVSTAATVTWGTSGTGGRGTWDTTNAGWWTGSAQALWSNAAPDNAVFVGTPSVVTMGSAITAGSVTFNVGGYALGGSNNLTASTLAGSGNATWLSSGTLTLSGASSYSGQFTIANGMVQLNSGASLSSASGIILTGGAGTVGGTGYPFRGTTRGGALYLRDDTGAPGSNQLMTTGTVTMRNGTILWFSGGGSDSTTITNVLLDSGFNSIGVAPSGGAPDALTITNLTRTAGATAEFRSSYGTLGTQEVQIKVTNFNGAPIANTNGILGGWAFAASLASAENPNAARAFAAWNPTAVVGSSTGSIVAATPDMANGGSGATTNNADIALGTSTQNWLNNGSAGRTISSGTVAINSLIEESDLFINNGSTLTLQSGGLIFRTNSFWMQTSAGATGRLTSGINDLFLQTDGGAGDQRIRVIIVDGTSGAVTLRKSGPGRVELTQTNTYTGGTVINSGTILVTGPSFATNGNLGTGTITINGGGVLQPNAAHQFGWTGGTYTPIAINDGGTFAIGGNDNYIGSLSLTDNAAVTGNSGNYVGVTGAVSYTGNYASSQATIAPRIYMGNTGGDLTATYTINGFNPAGDLVINGTVSGGGVTKSGSGTLVFNATNNYSGTTTINAGTLLASSSNSLPGFGTSGRVVFGGGTLQIPVNGTAWTMAQVDTLLTNATKTSGALALDIASGTQTQSGSGYTGDIGLTKLGAGTLTLSTSNSYTGTTSLVAGGLNLGNESAIGTGPLVITTGTIDNTSGGAITLPGNRPQTWGGNFTFVGSNPLNLGSGTVTLTASPQVTVTSSTLTIGGPVTGSFGLSKTGAGTLVLSGTSTFTGGATITGGIVQMSGANASTVNPWTVSGATLDLRGGTGLFPRSFFGNGGTSYMSVTSSGTLISDKFNYGDGNNFNQLRNNYYAISLDGGTLQLTGTQSFLRAFQVGTNGATVSVPAGANITKTAGSTASENVIRFTANSTLTLAVDGTFTLNDSLAPASYGSTGFAIVKNGTGVAAFGAQMAYTGNTTVNAGILDLTGGGGSAGVIRGTATVNAGATLRLSTGDATGWAGGASALTTINLVGGTLSVNTTTSNQTLGSGTINMTGGAITGTAGTNIDFFGGGSTLNTLASSTTSTISGGQISPLRQGNTTFTVAAGSTPSGIDLDISAVMKSSGDPASAVLTKAGAGTMRLSGVNTFGGAGVTIRSGTILAAGVQALSTGGTTTLGDASTGNANTALLIDASTASGTVARPISVTNQGSGATILGSWSIGAGNTATFSGAVTLAKDVSLVGAAGGIGTQFTGGIGGTGNVTVSTPTPGRVIFATTANGYAGTTSILTSSTLQLGTGGSTATSFLPDGFAVTVTGALSLAKGGNSETIDALLGGGTVQGIGGADTLIVGSAGGSGTFSGIAQNTATGTLGFTKSGAGTQVLTGSSTYTGATTITGGTLEIGGAGVLGGGAYAGAITNNAALSVVTSANQTLSGGISGSGNLVKGGVGTLTLGGSNSYTGNTTLAAGVVSLANADALGTTGTITFTGGTLQYTGSSSTDYGARIKNSSATVLIDTNGQNVTYAGAVDSTNTSGLTKLGSGTLTLSAANTYTGNTTISAGVLRLGSGGGSGSVAGNIVNNATLRVDRTDAYTLGNTISGSGGVVQAGSGTTSLSGANSYSGATTVTGGVLAVSTDLNLGAAPGTYTPGSIVIDGGTLAFTSGFTLTSNRGIALGPAVGSGTGTIDVATGQTLTYGGTIANNGAGTDGLVKAGGGILALTGAATYSGDTSVNAGTLQIGAGASLASPLVSLASGATLSGRGTVNAVTVADGGIFFPGLTGSGTLTTGPLTFSGASTITMGIAGGQLTNLLAVLGDVTTLGSGTSVTFAFGANLATITSNTYSLLTYTGTLSDPNAFGYTGTIGGRQTVSISGTSVPNVVSLVIGNDFPIWTGTNGIGWFASDNWELDNGNIPTNFQNADTVVFNDLATSGTVQITGSNATPASTTFAGNTVAMTLEAAGGFGISTGSLIKTGSALVTITNANTFGEGTTLSAGRLRVGDDAALGTGVINVTGPAALSSDGGTAHTLANSLHLDADVTLGDATDTGNLTFTGTVTFGGASRTITTPSTVTLSGLVTNGGLTKAGSGVLSITGSNTYANGTTLSAGTLRVGDNAALGSGLVTLNGGALSSDSATARTLTNALTIGSDVTLGDATNSGALTLGAGGVSLGGGARQLTTPSNVTLAGAVTSGGLTKAGGGTLTLSSANSYAAGTTLAAGDIVLGNVAALGTGTATYSGAGTIRPTVGGTIANAVAVNAGVSGTFDSAANATTLSGAVANAGTFTLTTTATQTLSGVVSGSGTLVKAGSGALTLSGPNTLTGAVSLTAGRLNLNSASALGTGSLAIAGVSTIDNTSGGAVALTGAPIQEWNADFTFAGSNALDLGTGAVTLGDNRQVTVTSSTLTVGGGIGGGFALTKAGAGTLVLSASNGYSGGTTLSAGLLQLGNGAALGTGAVALNGGSIDLAGLAVGNAVVLGGGTIGSGGTLSGAISGSGGLVKTGSGTLTLSGSNSYAGGTTLTGGTLAVSADSNLGAVPGSATPGSILVNGGVLAATASFTLDANRGIALGTASGTGSGTIDVATGQTLSYGGVLANNGAGVDGLVKTGAGTLSLSGANTYSGSTTLSGGTLQIGTGGATGSLTSDVATSAATALVFNRGNAYSFTNLISGAGSVQQIGTGTTTLGGSNTFAGVLTIAQGGVSIATINNASANGPLGNSASAVILGSSGVRGTLAYTGATASSSKAFTLATGGIGAVDVVGGTTLTLSGGIDGSGGFVKEGAGTLAFSTQKTYTGTTTVNAGVLALTGGGADAGTIRGVVNVNPGATLRLASNDNTGYGTTNQITAINVTSGTLDITTTGGSGQNQTLGSCVITLTGAAMTGVGTTNLDFFNGSSALTTLASSATSTISGIRLGIRQASGLTFTVADGAADTDLLVSSELYSNAGFPTAPFIKAGGGRMTLTAYSNVTANTNINAGALRLTGSAQLYGAGYNDTAVITVASGATFELDDFRYGFNGGTGQLSAYSARRVLNGGSIVVTGLTQTTGNLFRVANASSGTFTMQQAGQTLTIDENPNDTIQIGGPLTLGGAGNITINEVIGNNTGAGSIIKADAGTLTLNGVNAYTGSTTINSGTFILSGSGQLGSGNYAGAVTNNAAFLVTSSADQTFSGNVANAGTIAVASAGNQTLSGVVSGAGSFTKGGAGTLALSNASNSFTGGATLTAGVLSFVSGGLGSTGTVSLGGGTLQWAAGNTEDLSARLALANSSTTTLDIGSNAVTLATGFGAGSSAGLIKAGVGTLALAVANDYTGGTQVNAGTLAFANGGLGTTGNVTLAANTVLQWAAGNSQDISSRLVLPGSGSVTLDVGTNAVSLASGLGAGSAAALTKAGAGTLTLTGSSGYTGGTTIATGTLALVGTGRISGSAAMDLTGPSAVLDISGANGSRTIGDLTGVAGSRVLLGGNSLTAGGPGTTTFEGVISGSGGFTKATADGALALTSIQQFTGPATIAAGNLVLTGANLLQNATRIDVLIDGGLLAPAGLEIVGGQTLGGYGTVFGDVVFAPGGIVSPGGSTGTLPISGAVTWSGSSAYVFEMTNAVSGTAGTGWDLLTASGLTITATSSDPFRILLTSLTNGGDDVPGAMTGGNWDADASDAWLFVDTATTIDPFDPSWFAFDYADFLNSRNGEFSVARGDVVSGGDATQLYVVYAAVPEPGTLCLAAAGLGAVAAWSRGRRRRPTPH